MIGAIALIIVVLELAQRLWGSPSWDDVADTCMEDFDGPTCACIVRALDEEGYEPGDFEDDEDFSTDQLKTALPCLL